MTSQERDVERTKQTGCICPTVSLPWRRMVSLVCCFLLSCTGGLGYSAGNLSPYMTSYLRNVSGEADTDYTRTIWIFQSSSLSTCALEAFIGLLSSRLNTKTYLFIGAAIFEFSLVGTYWSIQTSFPLVVISYGVSLGIAQAIVYTAAVKTAIGWVPERKAFICGMVLTGYGAGAVLWNQLTTWLINPDNSQPDLRVNGDVYFTQSKVLENVPHCFLWLGTIFGGIHMFCLLFLCDPPLFKEVTMKIETKEIQNLVGSNKHSPLMTSADSGHEVPTSYRTISITDSHHETPRTPLDPSSSSGPQYHPKAVLKSRAFWTLWFMALSASFGTSFFVPLFKAYGQTFISDDHFLTLVASAAGIFNGAGRPFWGVLADRIGCRITALLCQCVLACLMVTLSSCETLGRMAFAVWVSGMFLSMCGVFTMYPAMIFDLFGAKYFNVHQGLLDANGVVGILLSLVIATPLKEALGWHGLYYVSFAGLFLSVLLNMSLSITWGNSIPQHMRPVLSLSS